MSKVKDDIEKRAQEIADKKLLELLTIVDENKVLSVEKGKVHIGGVICEDTRLKNLKSEAEFLLQTDLWTVIHETLKQQAQKQMFVSSQSLVDLQKGKTILFTLQSQQNFLDFLKRYPHVA